MERRFAELRMATTNDGTVELSQNWDSEDRPDVVVIPLDQIDVLIQWLQEAKAELTG